MRIKTVYYMLMVKDMDRAIAFYRDVIGLDIKSQSERWSEMAYGDAIIALHGGGTGEFQETGLGLRVADIDSACQEIAAGGGKVMAAPSDRPGEPIRLAQVVDTEGNGFSLTENI